MLRRWLIFCLMVALAAMAAPARAQTGGTGGITGTGGTTGTTALAAADFFIGVQHQEGTNLSDFEVARFFNKANCDCSEPVLIFVTLQPSGFAKRSSLMTGNIEFWVGTACDNTFTRNQQCKQLRIETLTSFFNLGHETLQTDARTISTFTSVNGFVDPDGGIVGGGTFTPTPTCTAPSDPFSTSIFVLIDLAADQHYDAVISRAVSINLTPPPAPTNIQVAPGNEALNVSWTGVDSSLIPDLLGYQVLCQRGADLQVFSNGTFAAGYKTCPATLTGTGAMGLDPAFACSPLLSRLATSFRVKILQNDITYGATVVAIDNSGNASAPELCNGGTPPLCYEQPGKTKSFYDVYRDGFDGTMNNTSDPGGASGGFCAVAAREGRAPTRLLLIGGAALLAMLVARRRRRR